MGKVDVMRALMAVIALLLVVGCTPQKKADEPLNLAWHQVQLPQPPDLPGRVMLRDAVACGGNWYIVGAVMLADGDTRPAAWTSKDGEHWSNVVFAPRSYYGSRSLIYTAGCRDGRVHHLGCGALGQRWGVEAAVVAQVGDRTQKRQAV